MTDLDTKCVPSTSLIRVEQVKILPHIEICRDGGYEPQEGLLKGKWVIDVVGPGGRTYRRRISR